MYLPSGLALLLFVATSCLTVGTSAAAGRDITSRGGILPPGLLPPGLQVNPLLLFTPHPPGRKATGSSHHRGKQHVGQKAAATTTTATTATTSTTAPTASESAGSQAGNFTEGPVTDYCGETSPRETFGEGAPAQADCEALARGVGAMGGFWTLRWPADFGGADGDGWATIASSGSCEFRLQFPGSSSNETEDKAVIGTNDVRFYVETYARDAQDGRIQAAGSIACFNGDRIVDLGWDMTHS